MKRLLSLLLLTMLMTAGAQELRIGVILPFTSQSADDLEVDGQAAGW